MSTPASRQVSIFLSYARDDEPFVKRLYDDLTARGFDVWWDRVSMPGRALAFLHEIGDAVSARDRLVPASGPEALASGPPRGGGNNYLALFRLKGGAFRQRSWVRLRTAVEHAGGFGEAVG